MVSRKPGKTAKIVREIKVSRTYRLNPARVEEARRALGVPTATAAIETALDMVTFRHELAEGTRVLRGIAIRPPEALDG
ncbi:MAG: hypothetical protein M3403_01975 [Gemmatimonadota bacterium]|nr:hypothetical protein [Gemmatimonadaceae bacterium]MDQ3515530.1 hypothetical protein [Gemmatimonadota bacterium]